MCFSLGGREESRWEEAQRWQDIPRRKEGRKEGWGRREREREREREQVICLAGRAESGSNVHLLWQAETTGPPHTRTGPSAELRENGEVDESSGVCVCVCVCV
ncbi:Hypothetical predicted protein [Xyrichtys novacula]|uniref:Uncharacterized protein n=1 Tax=Xyrichtys novacula TaxID=13765 RepID=A0AAV1GTQ9_XYRNO|nr:Hypothetical predicted protein [Xyrichtys novacula]